MMYQIQMVVEESEIVEKFYELAETYEELDVIEEKSFNGDLTTITLYISLTGNIIAILVPIIKTLIEQRKVSKLKMDKEKIELENVSEGLIKQLIQYYCEKNNQDNKNISDTKEIHNNDSNEWDYSSSDCKSLL